MVSGARVLVSRGRCVWSSTVPLVRIDGRFAPGGADDAFIPHLSHYTSANTHGPVAVAAIPTYGRALCHLSDGSVLSARGGGGGEDPRALRVPGGVSGGADLLRATILQQWVPSGGGG